MGKRIMWRQVEQYDATHNMSSLCRELEMAVDGVTIDVGHQAYTIQFKKDCILYGIDEAYKYLCGFIDNPNSKPIEPHILEGLSKVRQLCDRIREKIK